MCEFLRLLDMLLDPSKIRPRDIPLVFSRLGVNPVAKYITWRFIQSNWNRLVELYDAIKSTS